MAAGGRAAEDRLRRQVEAAVDRALAGPMPDSIARSMAEHHVAERIAREILSSSDFQDAVRAALASPELERIAVDAAGSRVTAEVAESVLQSPEVRAVLAQQTMGFGEELVARLRTRLGALDHRFSRRESDDYGGLATRGAALLTDLALAHLVVLFAGLGVWLLFSLVGGLRPEWLADTLAGVAWFVAVTTYFRGVLDAHGPDSRNEADGPARRGARGSAGRPAVRRPLPVRRSVATRPYHGAA